MIVTRAGFKKVIREIFSNHKSIADDDGAVWSPESNMTEKCKWFVCIPCLGISRNGIKDDYWRWCTNNLKGYVRCFMSDSDRNREWWGFTDKNDITLWLLRWSQ